ncbi:MAG: 3-deoxy-D-manno-octulosonic acid transferase, partial [Fusobacteriaceae bacterium]
ILLSVFTDTGYENVKNRYVSEERVKIVRFPLDDYFLIKKILKAVKLKMLIVVETEIWPNLISQASKNSKVIFINGRISDKSIESYTKFRFFLKEIFQKTDYFFMQSEVDRERIISLGADDQRVENVGNLKFSINFETYSEKEVEETKELISAANREIYVFGSTREYEEEMLLPYLKNMKEKRLLVIVPRHLHRIDEIERVVKENGFTYNRFSDLLKNGRDEEKDVLVVDMMGVQRKFYALCHIAFVGGTLVDIGGHSLLEPLFYGKTPIFGPHLNNVKDISRELIRRNLGYKVREGKDFSIFARAILDSKDKKSEIRKIFKGNSETLEKIVEKIDKMI